MAIECMNSEWRRTQISNALAGYRQRTRWGNMDRELVIEFAQYESDRLEHTARPFDLDVCELLDLPNPYHEYRHILTPTQRNAQDERYKYTPPATH